MTFWNSFLFILFSGVVLLHSNTAHAQKKRKSDKEIKTIKENRSFWEIDSLFNPVPLNRSMFYENVEKQIQRADMRDGTLDNLIELEDEILSKALTQAFLEEAPLLLINIENLDIPHQTKILYHRYLESMMRKTVVKSQTENDPFYALKTIRNFKGLLQARLSDNVMDFVKKNINIYTLENTEMLDTYPEAEHFLYEEMGRRYPKVMIKLLPTFAHKIYADPTIAANAKLDPSIILQYALSTSGLSVAVRRNQDPLVQSIVKIATEAKEPWKVLPFLGDIHSGKKTVREIDAVTADPVGYYKALVDLRKNTNNIGEAALEQELNYRGLQFVRVVNELHNSPASVRFKSLTDFRAEDLYFMALGSQNEIYTSSFVWMFNRMMEKMQPESGDAFLNKLHKSHFRTFIRMCAGYNTLSAFWATMDKENQTNLMKEFVADLEKGDADDLTDAVDVADAFGSITDKKLIAFLKDEVKYNYERTFKANNNQSAKGIIIYGLLSTIFNTIENSENMSGALSELIPPITFVPNQTLLNKEGRVIQQMFFYGDKDGQADYADYINAYRRTGKWKITTNDYWTELEYIDAKIPMTVYANRALSEDSGEDEIAQQKLAQYLEENNIVPTIIVHRGHSYYTPTTLEHLNPSVKIVMLGSCGGYNDLDKVLSASPDAHIISSKQIGTRLINQRIIHYLDSQIVIGNDINWLNMWQDLQKAFASSGAAVNSTFSDYVPPNRNLGAIFIKAYRKQLTLLEMEDFN